MSDQLFSFNSRSLLLFLLLFLGGVCIFHYTVDDVHEDDVHRMMVAGIGLLSNIGIIYYHLTSPPHPKFLLLAKRKVMVRLHAYLGMAEIIVGTAAYFTQMEGFGAAFAALALLHASTSFYQSPAVFGAKAVMIPSYFLVSSLHFYCGMMVLRAPTDAFWLMNTLLTLNIYAYVRMYMVVFEKTGLFSHNHYSASVLFAGFTVLPAVMGPVFFIAVMIYFLLFLLLSKAIFGLNTKQLLSLFEEKVRVRLVDEGKKAAWMRATFAEQPQSDWALQVFNKLDENGDGVLDKKELQALLLDWGMSEDALHVIMAQAEKSPLHAKRFSELMQASVEKKAFSKASAKTEEEKAKAIFNELDFDQSGYIERYELELLLLGYGLPRNEINAYMNRHDKNHDGRISFQEFQQNFGPLWRFAYSIA